jgi:hypothetical protein
VTHAPVIPDIQEAEIRRIMVLGQPKGKQFIRQYLNRSSQLWQETEKYKDLSPGEPKQKQDSISKITRAKRGWRCWLMW